MPPIQTTYTSDYAPGYAGLIANQETSNVISRIVADAAGLQFGVPVFQGPTDHSVTSTPGTPFVGFSVLDKTVRPNLSFAPAQTNAYAQNDTAAILTLGVVWVVASVAVVAGEPVFVTPAGLITDQASGDAAIPRASFVNSVAAGGLVKIRLA